MSTLLLALALSCSRPKLSNTSPYPWNAIDEENLAKAKHRCPELYPDAPCVKLFKKYNKQQYSVICGAAKKSDKKHAKIKKDPKA